MSLKWMIIPIALMLFTGIFTNFIWNQTVDGTKRWATHTGVLIEFDIDCSQCCHPSSHLRINTSTGMKSELIGDCDENLEHMIHVGNTYTIRIEPYAELYAITRKFGEPQSFWAVKIDWIKDNNGNMVYGNEWL